MLPLTIQDADQHKPVSPPPIYRSAQPSQEPENPFLDRYAAASALSTPSPIPDKKDKTPWYRTPCPSHCPKRKKAVEFHEAVCRHEWAGGFVFLLWSMLLGTVFPIFMFVGYSYLDYPTHNPDGGNITYLPLNSTFRGTYTTWNGSHVVNRTVADGHTAMEAPRLGFQPLFALLIATIILYKVLEAGGRYIVRRTITALWERRDDAQYRDSISFMVSWEPFQASLLAVAATAIMYGLVVACWYSEMRNIWQWASDPSMALQGRGSFRWEEVSYLVRD